MKHALLVVPDGSDDMEMAPFVEIPGWTKVVPGLEPINVTVAGWNDPIQMFHGLRIRPDVSVHDVDLDEYDALFLPGGWPGTPYFEQAQSPASLDIIRRAHASGKLIATMCTGIFPVGQAGLLHGVKATSFAGECCEFCRQAKQKLIAYGADFLEQAVVVDANIISDIGPAVGDEVALRAVEWLIGEEAVRRIVTEMMYTTIRPQHLKWTYPSTRDALAEAAATATPATLAASLAPIEACGCSGAAVVR